MKKLIAFPLFPLPRRHLTISVGNVLPNRLGLRLRTITFPFPAREGRLERTVARRLTSGRAEFDRALRHLLVILHRLPCSLGLTPPPSSFSSPSHSPK